MCKTAGQRGIDLSRTVMLWEDPSCLKQLITKDPGKENIRWQMGEELRRAVSPWRLWGGIDHPVFASKLG